MSIFQNLDALLLRDARAREYFAELSAYAKESAIDRAKEIRTYIDLTQIVELYGLRG